MSVFYGSIEGSAKTEVTRRGNQVSGLTSHTRGWNYGIKVVCSTDTMNNEIYEVWETGGSDNATTTNLLKKTTIDSNTQEVIPNEKD